MGALPKRKISKGRKNRRRAHNALEVKPITKCPKCGSVIRSHFECQYCGYYKKSK
jgi:large subunit ribosomal protein L32